MRMPDVLFVLRLDGICLLLFDFIAMIGYS